MSLMANKTMLSPGNEGSAVIAGLSWMGSDGDIHGGKIEICHLDILN
jgi:hypothetical protein